MKILLIIACFMFKTLLIGQTYVPTDQNSSVSFRIKNFGFNVSGNFTGLQGAIKFDPNDLQNSSIEVSVDASSINTGIDMRDNHLRGEGYFDVKNYPRIRFVSTQVTRTNHQGTLFVAGKLTIRNITKEISFPFTATPEPDGYLFSGGFKINRRDFSVGGFGPLSNEVTVNLKVFTKK